MTVTLPAGTAVRVAVTDAQHADRASRAAIGRSCLARLGRPAAGHDRCRLGRPALPRHRPHDLLVVTIS